MRGLKKLCCVVLCLSKHYVGHAAAIKLIFDDDTFFRASIVHSKT